MRKINFFDGATSGTVPTEGNIRASDLVVYESDEAFILDNEGAPAQGNIYYNSVGGVIRYYTGDNWVEVASDVGVQTFENKTIDGDSNTITNIDANNVNIDAVDGMDAETAQEAIEELYDNKIDASEKGQPDGVATLDETGRIPSDQMHIDAVEYKGTWAADTNTPTLVDGTGDKGDIYRVNEPGTVDFDNDPPNNPNSIEFNVGDIVAYNGTTWEKWQSSPVGAPPVLSVNGETGDVDLGLVNLNDVDSGISPSEGEVLTYSGGLWNSAPASGGSGEGGINYFTNGNFETNISDWTDSGGDLTVSAEESTPLAGIRSLSIDKAAVDASGDYVIGAIESLDQADIDKGVLPLQFVFDATHANYVSGDLRVRVWDVTNSAYLYVADVANVDSNNGLLKTKGAALVQVYLAATTAEIELRLEVTSDSATASAWSVIADRFKIGPDQVVPGAIVEMVNETIASPTVTYETEVTSITNLSLQGARINGMYTLGIIFSFNMGSGGNNYDVPTIDFSQFSFLSGKTISRVSGTFTSNINSGTAGRHFVFGNFSNTANVIRFNFYGDFQVASSRSAIGTITFYVEEDNSSASLSTTEAAFSTEKIFLERTNTVSVGDNATQTLPFVSGSIVYDTHGLYDATANAPKIKRSGWYIIAATTSWDGSSSRNISTIIKVNSSTAYVAPMNGLSSGNTNRQLVTTPPLYLNKDDIVTIEGYHNDVAGSSSLDCTAYSLAVYRQPDFSTFSVFGKTDYYESSLTSTATGLPATDTYADVASITLPPGLYDIQGIAVGAASGVGTVITGISTTSGNTSPGNNGVDRFDQYVNPASGTVNISVPCAKGNVLVTTTTTYYLKWYRNTANIVAWGGKIWARKIQ